MGAKNNQDWRNIYVLLFKTMAIMANWSFLIQMKVKEFKLIIHLIKKLFKTFEIEHLLCQIELIVHKTIKRIHIIFKN